MPVVEFPLHYFLVALGATTGSLILAAHLRPSAGRGSPWSGWLYRFGRSSRSMAEGDTLLNAVIGGIASIVLSFVPFSPVLGGALAGYLQGGDRGEGVRVGAYAGVVAAVPLALLLFVVVAVFGVFAMGGRPGGGAILVVFFLFAAAVVAGIIVGLSALGGWVGNYVRYDTDLLE